MIEMVLQERSFLLYIVLFFILVALFWLIFVKISRSFIDAPSRKEERRDNNKLQPLYFIIAALLLFIGIRGRFEQKSPIRVGTAYFSAYALPNQLGLNPVFTFLRSFIDDREDAGDKLYLCSDASALDYVARQYGTDKNSSSPFARYIKTSGRPVNANVVVVIVESMSAEYMARNGNPYGLTPFLDSLALNSYYFDNFYSAGCHTYSGIFSTLFSYPALLKQHPMKKTVIPRFTGFANTLHDNGYKSLFFINHDEQFDNISGFLYSNGYDRIYGQKDYPAKEVLSTLGVPDHIMFEQAISHINQAAAGRKKFFAAMMTASNHEPFMLPKNSGYRHRNNSIEKQIVEYTDWSLSHFINMARKQEWFRNTIFVIVADHGHNLNSIYDLPLSFHHSPCIIYAPEILGKPHIFSQLGGQIDIFPTVMGILNIPYLNNTPGCDILKERRKYIYFSEDEKTGCLDGEYFLVMRKNGGESLYHYKNKDQQDYRYVRKTLADSMRNYTYSLMQASQYLTDHNKTGK
jgi:phosphoglycerol transferase MdoB-like AlkP superfamily enzyme